MYFDALTLAAVVDELRAAIVGGRVQRVVLPGALSVALEIYAGRRYYLLLSAHPQFARVQLSPVRISRGHGGDDAAVAAIAQVRQSRADYCR
jgi:Predicted RNA-binding protein homologous to eukaryotic snRNP